MVQHCHDRCKSFPGYFPGGNKKLYHNDIIYCSMCYCGYKFINTFCPCCSTKIRRNSWRSRYRARRIRDALYQHAIDAGEDIVVVKKEKNG